MAVLDQATCAQAWADEGITLTPADLKSQFESVGYFNELTDIDSNMHRQAEGLDFNGTGLISFKMSGYLRFMKRAHMVSGDTYWVDRMEELLDWIFDRTDEALWNNGNPEHVELLNIPWPDRDPSPLIPYLPVGVPIGWDVNTPWCGWSRLFKLDDNTGVIARAEPLTDATIVADVSCALKHMATCGVGDPAKRAEWLSKARCVVEGWKGNWIEDRTVNIDPECDGGTNNVTIEGSFYHTNFAGDGTFSSPLANNQNAIMIQAMLTMNECDASICPDAPAMAAKLIADIKNHHFDSQGAWYYRLAPCASFEPHEDWGHFYITSGFVAKAKELGVVGADAALQEQFFNGAVTNSYLGGGNWSWLNSGQGVNGDFQFGTATVRQQGTVTGVTDPTIGGSTSNQLYELPKVITALVNLGSVVQGSPQYEATRDLLLQSNFQSPTMLEARACVLEIACDPPDDDPDPECDTVELCYITNAAVPDCVGPVEVCLVAGEGDNTRCVYPSTVRLRAKCPTGTRAVWTQLTPAGPEYAVDITELSATEMEYTITEPHTLGYKFCAKCVPL